MLKLLNTLTIGDKTFAMSDRINTKTAEQLNLPDEWYGGNAKKLTYLETKEGFYMCVDSKGNIINLAYDVDALKPEGKQLLGIDVETKTDKRMKSNKHQE